MPAFEAQVEGAYFQPFHGPEFSICLLLDGAAVGIHVYAGQPWEAVVDHAQRGRQLVDGKSHYIAVGQKNAPGLWIFLPGP